MIAHAALLLCFWFQTPDFQAEGMKALEAQQYNAAVAAFTKAAAADPDDFVPRFHLGLAYSLMNQDAAAIENYRKTLQLKPGLYQAELNLGMVLLRQKRPDEAQPLLADAARQKPAEFRPLFYLAQSQLDSSPADAEKSYQAALAIDPKSAAAEAGLGQALLKQNRLDEAAGHLRKACEIDAAYRPALLELAAAYEAQKQNEPAIAIYREFPENPGARERVGVLLIQSGQAADAIPQLEAAVKQSPTTANRAALATAYLKAKQFDKALPLVEQALQKEPNDYDLRMLYGRLLRDKRDLKPAAQQFFLAARIKPDSAEAWSEMAGVLIVAEDYGPGLAALDKVRQLGAEKAGHVFLRAITLDRLHQPEPALESYQRFLAMSQGQNPNEEFKARQRIRILEKEKKK